MSIQVDYREAKIIQEFKSLGIPYTTANLPIGDYIIYSNSPTDTQDIKCIIERKTISDLCSSITDGRFREQKQRLLDSFSGIPDKIVYIIEGSYSASTIPKTTVDSAILNLIFKHCYRVIFTESPNHTAAQIALLAKKITEGINLSSTSTSTSTSAMSTSNLLTKSKNQDPFIAQLVSIKGISANIASSIKKEYSCMYNLVEAYIQEPEFAEMLLSDIQVTPKRKLGKANSKKIHCAIKFKNDLKG
jgi:crossover junction endonuclease MUS81